VVTTSFLRRAPRRVAIRTKGLSLPGTYRLSRLLAGAAGAGAGAGLGLPVASVLGNWAVLAVTVGLGAGAGVFLASWSPLRGESIVRWALLATAKRNGLVRVGGRFVRAYVGVAPLARVAAGPTRTVPGAVPVPVAGTKAPARGDDTGFLFEAWLAAEADGRAVATAS